MWTREPTHPMMDQVWQPPEPKKRVELPQPTRIVDSPDAMLVYEMAALGGLGADLKVTEDGHAVLGGYQGTYTTYKLSSEEFSRLKKQIDATDFFSLADRYWHEDPPGMIVEMPVYTITYRQADRSKSVKLRGSPQHTPRALQELKDSLEDLRNKVREQGTPTRRPDLLVGYYLQSTDYTWWLDVDVEGGLYYSSGPAQAHMSPEDLEALRNGLESISRISSNEWYTAPNDVRDIIYMDEHRAIITTYQEGEQHQWINVLSGASVPKDLEALLKMLAAIYDKYAPE